MAGFYGMADLWVPTSGLSPHVPLSKPQPADYIAASTVLREAWADADRIVWALRSCAHDEAVVEPLSRLTSLQLANSALSWAQLCEQVPRFRLIRRSCLQQPSGKLRVIDDVANGGQSELSHKLDLTLRPFEQMASLCCGSLAQCLPPCSYDPCAS